ncbi:hypothetical protein C9J85_10635 [Haloferax sp. wsp5]|nr:hypothetical protein C9J85_10635 [Haloferax sp. wsp5]
MAMTSCWPLMRRYGPAFESVPVDLEFFAFSSTYPRCSERIRLARASCSSVPYHSRRRYPFLLFVHRRITTAHPDLPW